MAQSKPIVSIENIVASATIGQRLDLDDITKKFPDIELNSEQFQRAVFRLKTSKLRHCFFIWKKMGVWVEK